MFCASSGKKNLNTGIKNLSGGLSVRQNFVRGPRPAQTILHTRVHVPGIKGKSVEVLLIGSRAFSTTQRTLSAPATTSRVRQTFFLHQNLASMACSAAEFALHTRNFNQRNSTSTDFCSHPSTVTTVPYKQLTMGMIR